MGQQRLDSVKTAESATSSAIAVPTSDDKRIQTSNASVVLDASDAVDSSGGIAS